MGVEQTDGAPWGAVRRPPSGTEDALPLPFPRMVANSLRTQLAKTTHAQAVDFLFLFFLPLLFGVKHLGSCYKSHAGADFLRARCCDAAGLERSGARRLPQSDPCLRPACTSPFPVPVVPDTALCGEGRARSGAPAPLPRPSTAPARVSVGLRMKLWSVALLNVTQQRGEAQRWNEDKVTWRTPCEKEAHGYSSPARSLAPLCPLRPRH